MTVTIKQVSNRKELKTFVAFQNDLYKGNEYFVPKIFSDEMATLSSDKNPAFKFCDCALYLAYKEGKVVGRVAAIVNRIANEKWNHKEVRFGWIDYIDDYEVSKALIDKVIEFGKERGMDRIVGPLGFADFDPEGMLVEGFDQRCTMALIYNHPYYVEHMARLGFEKEADWLEYKVFIPEKLPERVTRLASMIQERYNLRIKKLTKRQVRKEKLGHKIFKLINESYDDLYNYTPLPQDLIDKYVNSYLGVLDLDFVTLVVDSNDEMVGVAITMPGITHALQKCGGKLFPFGWYHILRSLYFKHEENVELLLVGAKKEYRNKGILALVFNDLVPRFYKSGFKFGETNAELEYNTNIQSPWDMFEKELVKRRRSIGKSI